MNEGENEDEDENEDEFKKGGEPTSVGQVKLEAEQDVIE